jgi:hypothetical protein
MPPNLNLDLINDPRLYTIGAGIAEINQKDPVTGLLTGYHDVGNSSVVEPTNSDERFIKNESRTRYRSRVANLLLKRNMEITLNIDDWSGFAIGLWWQAKRTAQPAQLATPIVDEVVTTAAVLGDEYRLAKYGPITAYTLHNSVGAVLLVEGTDYVVTDFNVPTVRLLTTAVNVANGDGFKASYTPTAYTVSAGAQFDIGTIATVSGALRFIGDPPNGPRLLYDFWDCDFRPNGGLPLINTTNENTPISIIASVNQDLINHPTNPIGRILQLPA